MLRQALIRIATEVIMGLAEDIYDAWRNAKDANQRKAKLRGVLKGRLHEEVHNAMVRATR